MIKFENTEVVGWEAAIRGMRNPMNSWDRSDSGKGCEYTLCSKCVLRADENCGSEKRYVVGPNDRGLMMRLAKAGTEHAKYRRMIVVYVDITAPLYWWKEFDTYKVGTVANSCSTMHKIADKEFTLEDFSVEHLFTSYGDPSMNVNYGQKYPLDMMRDLIAALNRFREEFVYTKDKRYWWQMIQLLPSSYNQRRTVMLNYEVLANIYRQRKGHKLDEWREGFIQWIESLPYSEIITGKEQVFKEAGEEAGMSAMAPAT